MVILLMEEILHQLIGSLSHCLQGFIHPRWCRISSINSMMAFVRLGSGEMTRLIQKRIQNYFTSSDPHHDMLGGGCQVRVVIENMMGRMENLKTLISGFLGLVILVRWALVTMFLS